MSYDWWMGLLCGIGLCLIGSWIADRVRSRR
jgi:hypothetical protein